MQSSNGNSGGRGRKGEREPTTVQQLYSVPQVSRPLLPQHIPLLSVPGAAGCGQVLSGLHVPRHCQTAHPGWARSVVGSGRYPPPHGHAESGKRLQLGTVLLNSLRLILPLSTYKCLQCECVLHVHVVMIIIIVLFISRRFKKIFNRSIIIIFKKTNSDLNRVHFNIDGLKKPLDL